MPGTLQLQQRWQVWRFPWWFFCFLFFWQDLLPPLNACHLRLLKHRRTTAREDSIHVAQECGHSGKEIIGIDRLTSCWAVGRSANGHR